MKKANKGNLFTFLLLLLCATCLFIASCGKDEKVKYEFNTNGGASIEGTTLDKGTEFTLPAPAEREGYRFLGWYTTEDYSGDPIEKIVADTNLTFYAKWEKLYQVTLDPDGGQLAQTSLYLAEGEIIYDCVKESIPTKEGVLFGAWYIEGNELSKDAKMTTESITLTARYKVGYTIEIYKQKLDSPSEYEKDEAVIEGYEYPGEAYTVEQSVTGFTKISTAESVETKVLSENSSENVFKLYFDRNDIRVSFNSNYPDDRSDETQSVVVKYGQEALLPVEYETEGYCLAGWATSENGEIVYRANSIEAKLHNGDSADSSDKIVPDKDTALFAVWNKGYSDMFGGNDFIYLLDQTGNVVYLSRGGIYFSGIYDSSRGTFTFRVADDLLVRGRLEESDGSFCYYDKDRADYLGTLYKVGTGLVSNTTIRLAEDNGIFYNSDGSESEGRYLIDKDGYYVATFTDGPLSGQTLTLMLTLVSLNQTTQNAFLVRDEEDLAMGTLGRFVVASNSLVNYTDFIEKNYGEVGVYGLTLDGFGFAKYNNGSSTQTYFYAKEDDSISLMSSSSAGTAPVSVMRIVEYKGDKGYMIYEETLDRTIESANGDTLTLDGLYNVTYKSGTTEINGYYTVKTSLLGGKIVSFVSGNLSARKTYNFLVTTTQEDTAEEGSVTVYSFEKKPSGYVEYYYVDANSIYYAPLLVLDDEEEGKASVYGYTALKTYEKVSEGTYTYLEYADWYVYTAESYFEADVLTSPFDLSKVSSFVFNLDSTTMSYAVNYWYSMTSEDVTTDLYEVYTSASDPTLKITLVGCFAVLTAGDGKTVTTYSLQENLLALTISGGKIYLEINEEDKTFIELKEYYSAYIIEDGQVKKTESVAFDGKGGAVYFVKTEEEDENGDPIVNEYAGRFEDLGEKTKDGVPVYRFVSSDEQAFASFEFIKLADSSYYYVSKYNTEYNGTYSSEDGSLTLDGFCYNAEFITAEGSILNGRYYISAENEIYMVFEDGTHRYFDIKENKEFTVRGEEYGTYLLSDNQNIGSRSLRLDGYGNLIVSRAEEDESGENILVSVDEEGSYEREGDVYVLNYRDGNKEIVLIGKLSTYVYGNYTFNTFVVRHEEITQTYVDESDWSVLIFDSYGNVTKYGVKGEKETGSYILVTEELLYYVNEDGSDACIYRYDSENGVLVQKTFVERGYYTKDLESLLFSKYGFAIFNGETRYYYDIDEELNVWIYHQDETSENKNRYGFVAENLGQVTAQNIERDGKVYYNHEGFDIIFERGQENAEKYPLILTNIEYKWEDLIFKPTGNGEFSSSGQIKDQTNKSYSCSVVRKIDENGEVQMYFLVSDNVGYYRFDIEVNYDGINNTYEITGMSYFIQSASYTYMYYYYIYYSYFGVQIPNSIGVIFIERTYNEAGEIVSDYFNGVFGEGSGMYDTTGTIVAIENQNYTANSSTRYSVEFTAADGIVYRMYINLKYLSMFKAYGYTMIFTRVETFTTESGYTVEIERIIASDSYEEGTVYNIILSKGEEQIPMTNCYNIDGTWYYVVRTMDESGNKIAETKYYKLTFVEQPSGGPVEEGEVEVLPLYESVTLIEETVEVKYTQDERSFADVGENGVMFFSVYGTLYRAKECTKDEETSTYTILTTSGKTFTIVDYGSYVEINEVEESESAA